MAYIGQTITNPISGETITFTQCAADTDGAYLAFDLTLTPDGHVPGAHVHPEQEERFEVVSGTMEFRLGRKKIVAGPGETVVVPAGRMHAFQNGGDVDARVKVEVHPALKMEDLLENTVRLAEEGKTNRPRPCRALRPGARAAPRRGGRVGHSYTMKSGGGCRRSTCRGCMSPSSSL